MGQQSAGGLYPGTPWLPVAADASQVHVAVERQDPGSMLTFYHRLIHLRRSLPALAVGAYSGIVKLLTVLPSP